jgi:hypothetical protein
MLRENTDAGSRMITYNYTSKGKNHSTAQLEYLTRSKTNDATPGAGLDRDLSAGPIWLRAQLVMPQVPLSAASAPSGFALFYFGTTNPGSVAIDPATNVLTITASGSDIWDTTQSGEFLATPVPGDYSIRATVLEQPTTKDKAGKAGVMIRGDALADSRNAYLFASAGRAEEILFEGRTDYAPSGKPAPFSQTITKVADAKFPLTLMLSKTGGTVTAYTSLDGTNFTQAGTPVNFGALPNSYAGIAATAHKDATLVTAKFDAASIKIDAPYTPPAPAPAPAPAPTP